MPAIVAAGCRRLVITLTLHSRRWHVGLRPSPREMITPPPPSALRAAAATADVTYTLSQCVADLLMCGRGAGLWAVEYQYTIKRCVERNSAGVHKLCISMLFRVLIPQLETYLLTLQAQQTAKQTTVEHAA